MTVGGKTSGILIIVSIKYFNLEFVSDNQNANGIDMKKSSMVVITANFNVRKIGVKSIISKS